MATTYERLKVLMVQLQKQTLSIYVDAFSKKIEKKKLSAFMIKRKTDEGVFPQSISDKSILRLCQLLERLKLIKIDPSGEIIITEWGKRALEPDSYSKALSEAVFELLSIFGVSRQKLYDAANIPKIPDADSIYEILANDINQGVLTPKLFRQLLFLLACAGSTRRVVKVFYEFD